MNMDAINKVAVKIVVTGTAAVTMSAGVAVVKTFAKEGYKEVKKLDLDKLIK